MCKVAGIAKINDKNRQDAWLFMIMLGELMSHGNKHGLGYAAFDKKGNIFGEKWLVNEHAFNDISQYVKNLTAAKMDKIYKFFGDEVKRDEAQAIILHTRFATCDYGIKNTHPFINNEKKPEMAIIHNGVIHNHSTHEKKYSTCDSEVIVHLYDKYNVKNNFGHLDQVTNRLYGWYTVLTLSKTDEGRMVMDAFTDAPRLSSFYIPELDTRVFSTSANDILEVAKDLGFTCKDGRTMKANSAQRIDVLTGEVIERKKSEVMMSEPSSKRKVAGAGEVIWMNGNFNDEEFAKAFFNQIRKTNTQTGHE